MSGQKKLNKELSEELKRYSSLITKVSFTGDFVFVFFSSIPKANPDYMKRAIIDHLTNRTAVDYSFFKAKKNQWVFKQELL